jgi:surfeit locus 1 family protein
MRPRDWAIVAILFLTALVCTRLGIWQLSRRQERIEHNAWVESQLAKEIVPLKTGTISLTDWEFRRVEVSGQYDNADSLILRNRSLTDQPGIHVVTPLVPIDQKEGILIDRGWISNENYLREGIDDFSVDGIVTIVGIIRQSHPEPSISIFADPTHEPGSPARVEWKNLNVEEIQPQISYDLLPYYIALTEDADTPADMPIPNPEIDLTQGPHLSYAIQWFGFAAISLGGGVVWRRRHQSGKEKLNHDHANH